MDSRSHKHALQIALAIGALLLSGCFAMPETDRTRVRDYAAEAAGDAQDANDPKPAKRPTRRIRTSLALPYFSFAQSLNPRS